MGLTSVGVGVGEGVVASAGSGDGVVIEAAGSASLWPPLSAALKLLIRIRSTATAPTINHVLAAVDSRPTEP